MKIGLITTQAFSLHNFRGPLIRDWVAAGHVVYALAPDFDADSRARVAELGARPVDFRMERAGLRPLRDLRDLIGLARLLRRLNPDRTLAYFIKPVIYGTLAARFAGVPRRYAMVEGAGYVFAEGADGLKRKWLRALVTRLYRLALASARGVLFLNRDDVALFVDAGMVDREKAILLGGIGVDLSHFAPAPAVLEPPCFILVARLLRQKGVEVFVEAARCLRRQHPSARFLLLGSPDLNPDSVGEARLRAWHAEGVIEWRAHVADVRPWLAQASVFVLPTWYREGMPRSIQEAMAMARAVITTDTPGCRDAIEHGVSGLLVPPRDVDALVAAMARFIADPALIESMGQAARARAEACFDVHRVNRRISEMLGLGPAIEP